MNEINIKKELQQVANEALTLKVKSHGDLLVATDILSKLNQFNDRIQEEKEKITKPLNEALKAERARWKPAEKWSEEAIDHVRSEMTAYQTLITNEQKEKEKALADKLDKGELSIEETITAISSVETPAKNIATISGDVRFRETKILKIWDHTMIPREYMLPDEKAILTALKEGKKVEGCELEIIQTPVNYR